MIWKRTGIFRSDAILSAEDINKLANKMLDEMNKKFYRSHKKRTFWDKLRLGWWKIRTALRQAFASGNKNEK